MGRGLFLAAVTGCVLAVWPGPGPMFTGLGLGLLAALWPRRTAAPLVSRLARWVGVIAIALAGARVGGTYFALAAMEKAVPTSQPAPQPQSDG